VAERSIERIQEIVLASVGKPVYLDTPVDITARFPADTTVLVPTTVDVSDILPVGAGAVIILSGVRKASGSSTQLQARHPDSPETSSPLTSVFGIPVSASEVNYDQWAVGVDANRQFEAWWNANVGALTVESHAVIGYITAP
jgi:hypothetical protein